MKEIWGEKSTLGRRKAHTKAGRQEEQYGSRNQRYCSEYRVMFVEMQWHRKTLKGNNLEVLHAILASVNCILKKGLAKDHCPKQGPNLCFEGFRWLLNWGLFKTEDSERKHILNDLGLHSEAVYEKTDWPSTDDLLLNLCMQNILLNHLLECLELCFFSSSKFLV